MKKFNKLKGKAKDGAGKGGGREKSGANKNIDGTTHASILRTETIPWDQELMQLGLKSILSVTLFICIDY